MPTLKGETALTVEVTRSGDTVSSRTEARRSRGACCSAASAVSTAEGGTAAADPLGTLLVPSDGAGATPLAVRL